MEESQTTAEDVTVVVSDDDAGLRLDQMLSDRLDGPSRSRLKTLIKNGHVTRDGGTIDDPSYKVKPTETYIVNMPAPLPATPVARDIPLNIVFEDNDVIVVNKPAGMVVHPAAGHWTGTLVNAILFHCGDSLSGVGGVMRPGIVHRLDKDTSGLIIVAKNDMAHASLSEQFSAHTIERTYLALAWGEPRPLVGKVDVALARGGADRKKIVVIKDPHDARGRRAVTHYKVLQRYGSPNGAAASLVECRLETGRTHQIRVHLAHIGNPVIGDPLYGRPRQLKMADRGASGEEVQRIISAFRRQALHAQTLGFKHPRSAEFHRYEANLPNDMKELTAKLELL